MKRWLLVVLLTLAAKAQPNSNWGTDQLQAVQMPTSVWNAGDICGPRAVFVDSTDTGWIGGCAGMWYAAMTCIDIAPSTANSRGCWTNATSGLPALSDSGCNPYFPVRQFAEYSGTVYAVLDDPCPGQVNTAGSYGARWNGSAWVLSTKINNRAATQIAIDASGNIYLGDSGGNVYRSTDNAATFSLFTGWNSLGIAGGALFHLDVWNNKLYFNGEGPETEVPISAPTTYCGILSGDNGSPPESRTIGAQGCTQINTWRYAHNGRASNSNGTAGTAFTTLLVAVDDVEPGHSGAYLQRYTTASQTWTRPPVVTLPSPCSGTTTGMFYTRIVKGYTTDEFYISTGQSATCNAMLGSVDGGATWSTVGGVFVPCNNVACRFDSIGVSSLTDSKLIASHGNTTNAPYLYYHKSPGALPGGGGAGGVTRGGAGRQTGTGK